MILGLRKTSLPIFTSLATLALTLGLSATLLWSQKLNSPLVQTPSSDPQVLGTRSGGDYPEISISSDDWGSNGGIISLSSIEEPKVTVNSYSVTGEVDVNVYPASKEMVFSYLTVNNDNKQISPKADTTGLTAIASFKHQINKNNYQTEPEPITLPLEKTGIWLVTVSNGQTQASAFVIRSQTGVVVKEGDNQFIFWAQDFETRRSSPGGTISLLSLKNNPQTIASVVFSHQGIATSSLNADVDIGWYENNGDVALIPINMQYLNYGYNYDQFRPKNRAVKYFVFTDRPLYKPGDKLYFKAVIRDDDDARYTLPGGSAKVKVYRGYGEEAEVIYEQTLPLSSHGSVDGQVDLPETIKTDWYTLSVDAGEKPKNSEEWWYSPGSTTGFQVEYYRKPDYFFNVTSNKDEYIAGDNIEYTISGQYFFGQPLSQKNITYEVRSSTYYEYSYLQDNSYFLDSDYRYGGWYGDSVSKGTLTLNDQGVATLSIPATQNKGKSAVFSLTARLADETGASEEAVKNVVVYSGEFGIYRTNYEYGYRTNQPLTLPLQLLSRINQGNESHRGVSRQSLEVNLTRKWWEKLPLAQGEKYSRYEEKSEELPSLKFVTDENGLAELNFTPTQGGTYEIVVSGQDKRGNTVSQTYNVWVTDQNVTLYYSNNQSQLRLSLNKQKAAPNDTVTATINSDIPNRDIFISFERGRVNRYQIVNLEGNTTQIDLPLTSTDMPNIYLNATSFSDNWLDRDQINLPIFTTSQKLAISLIPNRTQYNPGENVTLDVLARDGFGQPVSSEIALWAVDKALFELVDQSNLDIFTAFWKERYSDTVTAHSLEGITALTAEQGGGCFASDTPILMADYTHQPINTLKIGDEIITKTGINNSALVKAKIIGTHRTTVDGYFIINNSLKVTANHRLFVNGGWHEARNLSIGDTLLSSTGSPITINQISWQRGPFIVYNLTIDQYHTFFADDVWVHNKGEARTVFKDTAYWNPRVYTDSSGKAQVTFKLPDNLTTWTVAAVGASPDTIVGDSKTDILVSKPVIVRPNLPNLLRLGDTVKISANIHNYTDTAQNFIPTLTFDAGIIEASPSAITIPSQGFKSVAWKVIPQQEKTPAKFTFSAQSSTDPKASDTIVQTLPVYSFGFYQKNAVTGQGSQNFPLSLTPDTDPQKSSLILSLSPSLVGTLPKAMEYLIEYPYGCVEQTTSRLVPFIVAYENPDLYATALADKDVIKIWTKGQDRLKLLQNDDGGWGWWSGGSDPFITAYVTEYLIRAQAAGLDVDLQLIESIKRYFNSETYLSDSGKDRAIFTGDALVAKIYAQSYLDKSNPKPINVTLNPLSPDVLPLAVMINLKAGITNPNDNGLTTLLSQAKSQGDSLYWTGGSKSRFASTDGTTALSLKALVEGNVDHATTAKVARYLINSRRQQYWSNTFATAQVIESLTQFSKTDNELSPNYTYTVSLDEKTISQGTISHSTQKIKDIVIPFPESNTPHTLALTQTGTGQLYSTLLTKTFHTDINSPAVSNNLTLTRSYESDKGPGYSIALGDTVTVKLVLSGLNTDDRYGVIEDELPAGLIPINPGFKNEQSHQNKYSYFWSSGVDSFDYTQNGVSISLSSLSSYPRTYSYKARVVNAGTFLVPPAQAQLMYSPEINARTTPETLTITSTSIFDPTKIINPNVLSPQSGNLILPIALAVGLISSIALALIYFKTKKRPSPPIDPPQV